MNRESERKRLVELIDHKTQEYVEYSAEMAMAGNYSGVPSMGEYLSEKILADGWMRPPVKVGQTVWLIKSLNWQKTEWGIKEGKISMIQQKADKSWKFRVTENHSVQDYTVDSVGKTVFTSREDAVKALGGDGE